jgi:hypothetical protein
MGRVAVGLVACALSNCATARGSIDNVARCPAIERRVVPPDWLRVQVDESFAFQVPSSCVPDTDVPQFVHGGKRLRCGAVSVDIVWGMWGPSSFGSGRQCKSKLGKVAVFVVTHAEGPELHQAVWYRTGRVHEPILSAWSTKTTDVQMIEAITHSGTLVDARTRQQQSVPEHNRAAVQQADAADEARITCR